MPLDSFYPWLKFDLFSIQDAVLSNNGLLAIHDGSQKIVILKIKFSTFDDQIIDGKLVSIIFNQFKNIKQFIWLFGEDLLLIVDDNGSFIWDPITNSCILTRSNKLDLKFARKFPEGYILVHKNGSLQIISKGKERVTPKRDGFIWNSHSSIVIYPFEFSFDEKELLISNVEQSRIDKRADRDFRNLNEIKRVKLHTNVKSTIPSSWLKIPINLRYRYDDVQILRLILENQFVIIQTKESVLIKDFNGLTPLQLNIEIYNWHYVEGEDILLASGTHDTYIIRRNDERIYSDKLVDLISQMDFELGNAPNYLFMNQNPSLVYSKVDLNHGFMWLTDYVNDHVFLDLFLDQVKIFQNTTYSKQTVIFIEASGEFILEWLKGARYPDGTLRYFDLVDDSSEPIVIYDHHEEFRPKKDDYYKSNEELLEQGIEPEDIANAYSLIIPEWTEVEFDLHYHKVIGKQIFSQSAAFVLLNELSKIPDNPKFYYYTLPGMEHQNFLLFGDYVLEINKDQKRYDGIFPIAAYNSTQELFATYNIDGRVYIWNVNSLLPVFSFQHNIPVIMKFDKEGKFLIVISFDVRTENIIINPKLRNIKEEAIKIKYPRIILTIINLEQNKKRTRSYRFPTHLLLENAEINIEEDIQSITISVPSYIDISSTILIQFSKNDQKFSVINPSTVKKFWQTHSRNSPYKSKKGIQFPTEPHPEIKREYQQRNFEIFNKQLFRKKDGLCIASAINDTKTHTQTSSNEFYDLEDKIAFKVPFYENRSQVIYLDNPKGKKIAGKNIIELHSPKIIPELVQISIKDYINDRTMRRRLIHFLTYLLENEIEHNENGISFQNPKINHGYLEFLKVKLDELGISHKIIASPQ